MKSSGLEALTETLRIFDSPSFRSWEMSSSATSSPGFLRPTELPKSPSPTSQITGSLLPGFTVTWKLLVVITSTSVALSNQRTSSFFVEATPLTVARWTSFLRWAPERALAASFIKDSYFSCVFPTRSLSAAMQTSSQSSGAGPFFQGWVSPLDELILAYLIS